MSNPLLAALALTLVFTPASEGSNKDKPIKNTTPLAADEIAIYRTVLSQYVGHDADSLNVSSKTYPLDPLNHQGDNECLRDIQLDNLTVASRSFHELTPSVLVDKKMNLVDPDRQGKLVRENDPNKTIRNKESVDKAVSQAFENALFSLSEIAFDKEHHLAVVSYSFRCGSLCGNGATLVLEKVGDDWKKTNRNCGGWIS
jgi:hypothetical protein